MLVVVNDIGVRFVRCWLFESQRGGAESRTQDAGPKAGVCHNRPRRCRGPVEFACPNHRTTPCLRAGKLPCLVIVRILSGGPAMTDTTTTMVASSGLTLSDVVSERRRKRPNQIAIIDPATSLTNIEWDTAADQVHAALHAHHVGAGDRVMFVGRNQAAHPVLFAATSRAGATLTGANWRLSAPEVAQVIGDCEPAIVFADREFTEIVQAAMDFAALNAPLVVLDPAARLGGLLSSADGADPPPPAAPALAPPITLP